MKSWTLPPWETGIYPGEMAAFLGLCDVAGVSSIIESGRGLHAYSTQVLGEYAERTGTNVISIDMEGDPIRGAECRRLLGRYSRVACLIGDAFDLVPRAASRLEGPIALLLDGPKKFAANRLSLLATTMFPIHAVAHHNSDPQLPWTDQFIRFFPGAYHYEQVVANSAEWQAFKRWERDAVGGYELPGTPGRSLSSSSLALALVAPGPHPIGMALGIPGLRARLSAIRTLVKWHRVRSSVMRARSEPAAAPHP